MTALTSYKDPDGDEITVDGTIKLCEDLEVDLEDVVMLAVAYELKSPRMGTWTRQGWIDGWKTLRYIPVLPFHCSIRPLVTFFLGFRCDNMASMKKILSDLRDKLASNPEYFKNVYNHTFDFARSEGQRSLGKFIFQIVSITHPVLIMNGSLIALETAQALWALLLPHGLQGGALSHLGTTVADADNDVKMDRVEQGWTKKQTQLWFDFLAKKGMKGISRDTWQMVSVVISRPLVLLLLVCTLTTGSFSTSSANSSVVSTPGLAIMIRNVSAKKSPRSLHLVTFPAAWPSTFDDFVDYAKEKGGI